MKEDLKTSPCTMAKLCQKPPVVFEIDPEKNGYAEYKLPVRYRIENIVAYILSELDQNTRCSQNLLLPRIILTGDHYLLAQPMLSDLVLRAYSL
jgi:hypothetical protein